MWQWGGGGGVSFRDVAMALKDQVVNGGGGGWGVVYRDIGDR